MTCKHCHDTGKIFPRHLAPCSIDCPDCNGHFDYEDEDEPEEESEDEEQ